MKKIFLVAGLFCFITAGVNAHPGPGKTSKKGAVAKTTVISTTPVSDTTHHKKSAMSGKKHYKKTATSQAKEK